MANVQIPNLPVAIALGGNEQFELVQAGVSRRAIISQLSAYNGSTNFSLTIYGDEDVTYAFGDSSVLYFNSPLTAARTVTLGTSTDFENMRVRIVRSVNATGADLLQVSTLKDLSVSEWCDVQFSSGVWYVIGSGPV